VYKLPVRFFVFLRDNDIVLARKFSLFHEITKNKAHQSKITRTIIKSFFMEYVVKYKTIGLLVNAVNFNKNSVAIQ
jgi:hypothetical protein